MTHLQAKGKYFQHQTAVHHKIVIPNSLQTEQKWGSQRMQSCMMVKVKLCNLSDKIMSLYVLITGILKIIQHNNLNQKNSSKGYITFK